jgi:hypothetical protein
MRRSMAVLFLLIVAGCSMGPNPDTVEAEKFVRNRHNNVTIFRLEVEEPEYATFANIPDSRRTKPPEKPAACAVRIRFTWGYDNRRTHDDWLVWMSSDHKMVDYGRNPESDNWRRYVRAAAKK